MAKRRSAALPAGLTSGSSIYVAAAGGGVVVDVDDNSFIDFGSGIAVTTVGNSAPRVVERTTRQLGQFTHTCFLANPYEGYLEVCEALNRLTLDSRKLANRGVHVNHLIRRYERIDST